MSENFGLKIGLEGEKEFKKSLTDINNSFKVLGSEMKLVDSQFDKNDKSAEALTARNQVLGKEIDQQKQKIETLCSALPMPQSHSARTTAELKAACTTKGDEKGAAYAQERMEKSFEDMVSKK